MSDKELLGAISVVLSILGYSAYIWSIFKRQTKPHVFSWFVWGLITAIASFAQYSKNAGPGMWATAFTCAACFLIVTLGIFKGEKDIKQSDTIAFVGALAAIPLWLVTKNPLYAVFLISLVELFAFYPTIRKSWMKPREELAFLYALDAVKYLASILAMESFSLTATLYPFSVLAVNSLFVGMLLFRRRVLGKNNAR